MDENGLNESTSVVEILTLIKTAGKRECCMYLFEKSTLNITDSSLFYCMLNHMEYRMLCWWHSYGGRETSKHCRWKGHRQIRRASGAAGAHNTTKWRSLFAGCFCFFICLHCVHLQRMCCQIDWRFFLKLQVFFFSICIVFFYLFVLWAFAAPDVFLICWCFFYLHVFSEVAAHWALTATVKIIDSQSKSIQI